MNERSPAKRLIGALAHRGFSARVGRRGLTFRGVVQVRQKPVPIRLEFEDLEFAEPPRVYVDDPSQLSRPVIPHLDEGGELCVVERRQYIADRYLAPGQALGLVDRAAKVLEAGLTKAATAEIAAEFPQHWGGNLIFTTFGRYNGALEIVPSEGSGLLFKRTKGAKAAKTGVPSVAVTTAVALSFSEAQKRPDTLGELFAWAAAWDQDLPGRLKAALISLSSDDPYCVLTAPNGTVAFQVMVSQKGLRNALKRPQGWARAIRSLVGENLPIRRLWAQRVDLDYILGRNGDGGVAPLAGKNIVLVGCGAIGGWLSRALAQLGAGLGGGHLDLLDPELLDEPNIGRHWLGRESIGKSKADECRRLLLQDFPGLSISAFKAPAAARKGGLAKADLLLDATGERGVSEMLNAWFLEAQQEGLAWPTMLHIRILGLGAAVQSYISTDSEFGCFRCLQPDHDQPPRYEVLKATAPRDLSGGCGEAPFTPYGPSAPIMAAGLAAQHAVDWSKTKSRPLMRTQRLDLDNTNEVKPTNPLRSTHCPACGGMP